MTLKRLFTFWTIALLSAVILSGQEYRAKVQGVILDSSQAAIANATVTLRNINTGVAATRQSNETGRYLFD